MYISSSYLGLVAPLCLVHLTIEMNIIFGNLLLKLEQAKIGRLAVGLAQWDPVDLPLRWSICLNQATIRHSTLFLISSKLVV